MVRQPPQLLTRVIRAIASLREPKGSSVSSIITQVRIALSDASSEIPRNITMQVRRALKHAMDNGLVQQRAGRYRVAGKKRVVPVDSMELAADRGRKRKRTGKKRRRSGRRHSSEHDRSKTHRQRRRSRRRRGHSRAQAAESQHSVAASKPSTAKNTERQATPNAASGQNSTSNIDREQEHSGTPFPDSEKEASPAGERRRGRPRKRRPQRQSHNRNHSDGLPTVDDEPMDDEAPRLRSIPRNMSPRRNSMPQQREQEEKDGDSLDEIHDRPPSYYN